MSRHPNNKPRTIAIFALLKAVEIGGLFFLPVFLYNKFGAFLEFPIVSNILLKWIFGMLVVSGGILALAIAATALYMLFILAKPFIEANWIWAKAISRRMG